MKVLDRQTGTIIDIPESQVQEAAASGRYAFQKGIQLPVISPDGTPGTIDAEEASKAFDAGFVYETSEQRNERKRAEEFGDREGTAFVAGAARGLSFGLSDQVLTKTGLVEPQTLSDLEKYNPASSIAGEVTGTLAPLVLSGGTSLLAKGAQVAGKGVIGASRAGHAAEKIVAKTLAKRLTEQGQKTIARKVLEKAGPKVVGSAVEGAFYGAGHIISEDALGNADLNAESLLANMGLGALIGGTAGGVFAGVGLAKDGVVSVGGKVAEKVKPSFRRILGITDESGLPVLGSMTKVKGNIEDLSAAAERLDIELTVGAKSASPVVRGAESIVNESPGIFGEAIKRKIDEGYTKIQRNAEKVIAEAGEATEKEVGDAVKNDIINEVKEKYDPIEKAYAELKKNRPLIPLYDKMKERIARNLEYTGGRIGSKGSPIQAYTRDISARLRQQESVDDLRNLIAEVNSDATAYYRSGNTAMATAAKAMKQRLEVLERRTVRRAMNEVFGEGSELADEFINFTRSTNAEYAKFKDFINTIGAEAKLGRISGAKQFIDKIDSLEGKQVVNRLFNPDRLDAMDFFRTNFPKQFEEIRKLKIAEIAQKVTKNHPDYGPQVDIPALIRLYDKMQPEYRRILFGDNGVQIIEDIKTVYPALTKTRNPSGTDVRSDFTRLLTPILNIRDLALVGLLKAVGETQESAMVKAVDCLAHVEKSQKKTLQSIKKGVDRFLKGTADTAESIRPATTNVLMDTSFKGERKKKDETKIAAFERQSRDIAELASNPELLSKTLGESTALLGTVAPKTTAALQMKASTALAFLDSKLPKNPAAGRSSNLMIRKWKPSTVAVAKFQRYLKATTDPMSVVKDFEKGRLSREGVETLKNVYPEIYMEIIKEVTDKVSELRLNLPYKKRLQLGSLLDSPVDLAQQQDYLQTLQAQFQPKEEQGQQGAVSPTVGGMKNLNASQSTQTETQRILNRA